MRLDRRGRSGAPRREAGPLPQARRRQAAGHARLFQHLDDPACQADRGHAGRLRARLHDHAFLQPATLHAPAGGRDGSGDRPCHGGEDFGLRRRQARQEPRHLQRQPRLHRQPPRHLLAAGGAQDRRRRQADDRRGRCRHGQAVRHTRHRRVRPDGPRRARPRSAHQRQPRRGAAEDRRLSRDAARFPVADEDDRRRLHRPQGKGRLLPDG